MHEPKGPATQETSASLDRSVERSLTRNAKNHEIKNVQLYLIDLNCRIRHIVEAQVTSCGSKFQSHCSAWTSNDACVM
jgi:hypothetical protein